MPDENEMNAQMATIVGSMPWWLVMIWGILAVLLGILLVATPIETTFYLILLMGVYWFIGGIFTLASLVQDRTNMAWRIFLSVISILAGIVIMCYPLFSTLLILDMLIIIIGLWGIIIGITKFYEAFRFKNAGAGILGVVSIFFGIILLLLPYAAAIALPIIAGFIAIIAGFSAVFVAFQVKKGESQV